MSARSKDILGNAITSTDPLAQKWAESIFHTDRRIGEMKNNIKITFRTNQNVPRTP
jgi:hypothetical protein